MPQDCKYNTQTEIATMNNLTILAAGAFLAAPMCMVAQAEPTTIQEYAAESIQLVNDMADILEKVTPETADACAEEMNALKPRLAAMKAAESKFTDEEKASLSTDKALEEKMMSALTRMMTVAMKLQMQIQSASPEDQAKMMKVIETMQTLGM